MALFNKRIELALDFISAPKSTMKLSWQEINPRLLVQYKLNRRLSRDVSFSVNNNSSDDKKKSTENYVVVQSSEELGNLKKQEEEKHNDTNNSNDNDNDNDGGDDDDDVELIETPEE